MKLSALPAAVPFLLALATIPASATEVVLVNWNHTWDYMMPMGLDPALGDPDFNATWFLDTEEFTPNYNGPTFGGATDAGNAGNPSSINHGSGPGPLGYDVIDYFGSDGAEVFGMGTT